MKTAGHTVTFYDYDGALIGELADYVADGLRAGECVIVIATDAHREALDNALGELDIVVAAAHRDGDLVTLDAATTLARFVVDGQLSSELFEDTIADLIRTTSDGRRVRAFGEMVGLLWADGDVTGALELESLWNDLMQRQELSLMCGYPRSILRGARLTDITDVCAQHTTCSAPETFATRPTRSNGPRSEVFLPAAHAVAAARRFVTTTLASTTHEAVTPDAVLIASELVTNAVRHAQSVCRISVSTVDDAVRLEVEDVSPATPVLGSPDPTSLGGRGMAIVDRLARRWGCLDTTEGTKIVWAECTPDERAWAEAAARGVRDR